MRILVISLMASMTAAAKTPETKPPTYIPKPVVQMVPQCEAGWHLEQWHYGNEATFVAVPAIYHSDESGYRVFADLPKADPHPDRCVKDAPKAK